MGIYICVKWGASFKCIAGFGITIEMPYFEGVEASRLFTEGGVGWGGSGRSLWHDVAIGPVSFFSTDSTPRSLSPSVISGWEGGDEQHTTENPACASGKWRPPFIPLHTVHAFCITCQCLEVPVRCPHPPIFFFFIPLVIILLAHPSSHHRSWIP